MKESKGRRRTYNKIAYEKPKEEKKEKRDYTTK